jgi:hypothetical protein
MAVAGGRRPAIVGRVAAGRHCGAGAGFPPQVAGLAGTKAGAVAAHPVSAVAGQAHGVAVAGRAEHEIRRAAAVSPAVLGIRALPVLGAVPAAGVRVGTRAGAGHRERGYAHAKRITGRRWSQHTVSAKGIATKNTYLASRPALHRFGRPADLAGVSRIPSTDRLAGPADRAVAKRYRSCTTIASLVAEILGAREAVVAGARAPDTAPRSIA